MQLLRTSPVRMYEILLPKLLAGTLGTFVAVGTPLTVIYLALLAHGGSFGLREHLPLLGAVLGTLLLASLAYTSIFLLINALVQRPLPVSLVYWLVWEMMLASGDSQRFSVMHYLRSFALPQLKYFRIEAGDLGLTAESLGGEFATVVSIATDPGQAVAVLLAVTALAFMLASRLLERKQF
jgi:ABC-type transport system involved in multi-copper enzyme maturation permease subunit